MQTAANKKKKKQKNKPYNKLAGRMQGKGISALLNYSCGGVAIITVFILITVSVSAFSVAVLKVVGK